MTLDRVGEMAREYGEDTVLVFGGAILCDAGGVRQATEACVARVRSLFPERLSPPR
jgi:hypothetical protein